MASAPRGEVISLAKYLIGLSHIRVLVWAALGLLAALIVSSLSDRFQLGSISLVDLVLAVVAASFMALICCSARVLQGIGKTNVATFFLNIIVPGLFLVVFPFLMMLKEPSARDLILIYTAITGIVYVFTVIRRKVNTFPKFNHVLDHNVQASDRMAANKLGVVVMAQQLLSWTALLVVPWAYGDVAYQSFVVIQKVSTLISLTMLAVNFTFSRKFAALYVSGLFDDLQRIIKLSLFLIIFASILIAVLLGFSRSWLFDYARLDGDMTYLLCILVTGQVFYSFSALFSVVLSMAKDEDYLFRVQAIVNGIASLAFICGSVLFPLNAVVLCFVAFYFAIAVVLGLRVKSVVVKKMGYMS
jgi:hypothetical protein